MDITADLILSIISHCSKIHHSTGRLRLRVKPSIKDEIKRLNLSDSELENFGSKLKFALNESLKNVKFNSIIGSLTIEYDKNLYPYEFWESALRGENLDEISKKLDCILKEVS